jgi:hypothetical protein
MGCIICGNLKQAFEVLLNEYIASRSTVYYRVCTELAAYKNVDMERAKSELEEHQCGCVSAKKESAMLPAIALLRLKQQEWLRADVPRVVSRTI